MIHPRSVQDIINAFLEAIDTEVPALVEGLYRVGSLALDDFRPHSSDIDFVAITAGPLDASSLLALKRAHSRLARRWPRPFFDGIYVTWKDLRNDPAQTGPGPYSQAGRFHREGPGERNPVTWQVLARNGVRCRGPVVADVEIWTDPEVLASWTNGNLDSYWRRLLNRCGRLLSPYGAAALTSHAAVWCVLGVSRLHYTLATGEITSKEGAGIYALAAFPAKWSRLIEECLRIRRASDSRSLYRSPFARRREVLEFTEMVIADAHRLYDELYRNNFCRDTIAKSRGFMTG